MPAITAVTFGLAFVGYLVLCAATGVRAAGRDARRLTVAAAAVAVVHVGLVWHVRYAWSPDAALAHGLTPVVIFHAALLALVGAALAPGRWSGRLLFVAFPIVTAGALGAVFTRDVVAVLRWPVVAAAGLTVAVVVLRSVRRAGVLVAPA